MDLKYKVNRRNILEVSDSVGSKLREFLANLEQIIKKKFSMFKGKFHCHWEDLRYKSYELSCPSCEKQFPQEESITI